VAELETGSVAFAVTNITPLLVFDIADRLDGSAEDTGPPASNKVVAAFLLATIEVVRGVIPVLSLPGRRADLAPGVSFSLACFSSSFSPFTFSSPPSSFPGLPF
jgi:hypothetical protein